MTWMKVHDIAIKLRLSDKTVRSYISLGLPVAKVKGTIFVRSDWLDSWLSSFKTGSKADEIVRKLEVD